MADPVPVTIQVIYKLFLTRYFILPEFIRLLIVPDICFFIAMKADPKRSSSIVAKTVVPSTTVRE